MTITLILFALIAVWLVSREAYGLYNAQKQYDIENMRRQEWLQEQRARFEEMCQRFDDKE